MSKYIFLVGTVVVGLVMLLNLLITFGFTAGAIYGLTQDTTFTSRWYVDIGLITVGVFLVGTYVLLLRGSIQKILGQLRYVLILCAAFGLWTSFHVFDWYLLSQMPEDFQNLFTYAILYSALPLAAMNAILTCGLLVQLFPRMRAGWNQYCEENKELITELGLS